VPDSLVAEKKCRVFLRFSGIMAHPPQEFRGPRS
jgi:hypothetical protein